MYRMLLCVQCVVSTVALKAMFENFEHISGFDEVLYNVRVRKINRTTTALNGTIIVTDWIDNDIQMSMDLFHSRLGNQQFNHYPMKLPTGGTCDFLDNLHSDYEEYLDKFENFPAKGECPISPRSIAVRDLVFPPEIVMPFLPRGLWKSLVTAERSGQIIYSFYLLIKVYDEF